jgi:hypothetical protein
LNERACESAADTEGFTGDDSDFAVQISHWDIFSCRSLNGGTKLLPNLSNDVKKTQSVFSVAVRRRDALETKKLLNAALVR